MESNLTWKELIAWLRFATEEECAAMLKAEQAGKFRSNYILRLYGRFSKLREDRERRALFSRQTVLDAKKQPQSERRRA